MTTLPQIDVELARFRDLVAEADTARAEDAALGVEDDVGPEDLRLRLVLLPMEEAARLSRVAEVVVLEDALTRLVADGTVDGVVEEDELEDRLAGALDALARGLDLHAVHHLRVARGHGLWRLVRVDEAHAAVRGDGEAGVIAEGRDLASEYFGRLELGRPRLLRDFTRVDFERWHRWSPQRSISPPIMLIVSKVGMMSAR
jgi:hypothetical protein